MSVPLITPIQQICKPSLLQQLIFCLRSPLTYPAPVTRSQTQPLSPTPPALPNPNPSPQPQSLPQPQPTTTPKMRAPTPTQARTPCSNCGNSSTCANSPTDALLGAFCSPECAYTMAFALEAAEARALRRAAAPPKSTRPPRARRCARTAPAQEHQRPRVKESGGDAKHALWQMWGCGDITDSCGRIVPRR